ncbi:MAG: VCBS repeat-containing protein [Deltaproteobacteria bacterium]|nr:VCBS repeat-containing protein [Deltaproteobacteria bacterium]
MNRHSLVALALLAGCGDPPAPPPPPSPPPGPPPRLLAPWSGALLGGGRLTLRWTGEGAARVTLCRGASACTERRTLDANGGSLALTQTLPRGTWSWRVTRNGRDSATWRFTVTGSAERAQHLGVRGDLDGDGRTELLVGAPGADGGRGRVWVLVAAEPQRALTHDAERASFGGSVAHVGDLDGDGFTDAALGAPGAQVVRVYRGGPSGLAESPWVTLANPEPGASGFGTAVAGVGDLDGDGYGELAVGSPFVSASTGRVYLWRGRPDALPATPDKALDGPGGTAGLYGGDLTGAGDLDGDGLGELVVGAYRANSVAGAVYVYRGRRDLATLTLDRTLGGAEGTGSYFGERVAGAGDLDGDGFPELAVGAPNTGRGLGRVYLFRGGSDGFDPMASRVLDPPEGASGSFGGALGVHGDVNGDGLTDLVVGAPASQRRAGRVVLFVGRAGAPPEGPGAVLESMSALGAEAGHALAANGDHDGDGVDDLAVGVPQAREARGLVQLVRGRTNALPSGPGVSFEPAVEGEAAVGSALAR